MPQRAAVVGGSLAGLLTANLLHRAGWAVTVHERTAGPLAGRGAGIVTHPALFEALRQAGVPEAAPVGVPVAGRTTCAPDGSVVDTLTLPQVLTSWSQLHRLLREALPPHLVRPGSAVAGVSQDAAGITLHLAGGGDERADLVVGADRLRSALRAAHLPGAAPEYVGYVAWRGVVPEARLSPATRSAPMPYFAFACRRGSRC